MIAFEIVRWVLITGFLTFGVFMFKMITVSLGDWDRDAPLRFTGGWILLAISCILAVVTFHVQP